MDFIESRRTLLKGFCGFLGVAATGPVLADILNDKTKYGTPELREQLATLADLILPQTDTPSASDVGAENFVLTFLEHIYTPKEVIQFHKNIARHALQLTHYKDNDAFMQDWINGKFGNDSATFFKQLKSHVMVGYYNTEVVATKVLAYLPLPGEYKGDISFDDINKAWAM